MGKQFSLNYKFSKNTDAFGKIKEYCIYANVSVTQTR